MFQRLVGAAVGAVLVGGVAAVASIPAVSVAAQSDDQVTLTIGLLQDLSSPNVTQGYLVSDFEL
jgi:hypothetical protein